RFVASFLGDSNFLPGSVREVTEAGCVVETAIGSLVAAVNSAGPSIGTKVTCSIRPPALVLAGDGPNRLSATVEQMTFHGELLQVSLKAAKDIVLRWVFLPASAAALRTGETITLTVPPAQVVVLPDADKEG